MATEIEPIGGATTGTNWTRSGNTYTTTGQFANLGIPLAPLTSGKICFEIDVVTSTGTSGIYCGLQRTAPPGGNSHNDPAISVSIDLNPNLGTRITVTIDIDNGTIQRNNETPLALAGSGTVFYFGIYDGSSASTGSITLYFKETEFINPIPSGATAWYETLNPPVARFTKNGNDVTSANEGDTVTVNIISDTTATGTVNYTLSGISSADINDASLTGSVSLTNYEASFDIVITNDVTTSEGVETLTVSFLLDGTNYSYDLTINDSSATQFVASGGALTELNGYGVHTFTSSGTFTVTAGGTIEYLVIAGGGGGGSDMGGGGGAGGYLAGSMALAAGTYSIVIGAGGSGAPAGTAQVRGYNGVDTVALGLTAFGGGGGASTHTPTVAPAGDGGSGGGGSGARTAGTSGGLNGTGTPGQGNDGANSGNAWYPGGGGGAGAAAIQTGSIISHGGIGIENSILGTSYYWAAGGGGAGYSLFGGDGGLGGGGGGAPRGGTSGLGGGSALNSGSGAEIGITVAQTNKRGGSAGANTGSGGGGGSHYNAANNGGDGGSGIVILRYTTPPPIIGFNQTGGDLTITLRARGGATPGASQPNGTVVPYTISGDYITESSIGQPLTGNFVLTDNTDEITINVGTIPNTTLVFTAFGETVSYETVFPATLVGDAVYAPITFDIGYYKTLPVHAVINGIPVSMSDSEWVSNGAVGNYNTKSIPKPDLQEVVPYRFTTVSGGGRMNTFPVKPLGAEIIIETWY
jgi:hypothetical protein